MKKQFLDGHHRRDPEDAMVDVFISYAKVEKEHAEAVAASVSAAGYTVWWDTSLLSGDSFKDVILENLTTASAVIVVWGPHSVRSQWVYSEANRGRTRGVLVPVHLPSLDLASIPPPFDTLHTISLEDHVGLVAAIAKTVGKAATGKPMAIRTVNGGWHRRGTVIGLGAAALAAGVGGYAWTSLRPPSSAVPPVGPAPGSPPAAPAIDQTRPRSRLLHSIGGHGRDVLAVALSRDGRSALTGGKDQLVRRIDVATGRVTQTFDRNDGEIRFLAFSSDASLFAVVGEHQVLLRESATGEVRHHFSLSRASPYHTSLIDRGTFVRFVRFSSDSKLMRALVFIRGYQADMARTLSLVRMTWDTDSGAIVDQTKDVEVQEPFGLHGAISASGTSHAVELRSRVIWVFSGDRPPVRLIGHAAGVSFLRFMANDTKLVSCSEDKTVRVWDLKAGAEEHLIEGAQESIVSAAMPEHERWILTGGFNQEIRLWSLNTGRDLLGVDRTHAMLTKPETYRHHYALDVTPNGKTALSAGQLPPPQLWDLTDL
jgi:WD40 repeat protein